MEIALVVGFSLLLAVALVASVLLYSHYIYSKNRAFSKTKYSVMWIVISSLLGIFMLVAGILFALNINSDEPLTFAGVYSGLSFAIFALCIIYLCALLLMPKLTNKNKIEYTKILETNYDSLIKQTELKMGDVEALKNKLIAKHTKYYQAMLSYYEGILNRVKNPKISKVEKLADIVTFNDAFTNKWSTYANYYQLLLTFKFCEILKKIS